MLILGVLVATKLSDVYTVLQFAMTINVPFGASILLMFTWRRLTAAAVRTAVVGSAVINIVFPLAAQHIAPLRDSPALTLRTTDTSGRPLPGYFETVFRADPDDANSALVGRGCLHTELLVLPGLGVDVVNASAGSRRAGRFLVDARNRRLQFEQQTRRRVAINPPMPPPAACSPTGSIGSTTADHLPRFP